MAGLFVSEETVMKAEKARPRPCILWPLEPVRFASPGRLAGGRNPRTNRILKPDADRGL